MTRYFKLDQITSETINHLRARYGDEAVDAAIKREAERIQEEAKQMRVPLEVQGACPHSMVGKYDGDEYWCVDCKQRVYPDPDWFDKGFLLYGGK